MIPFAPLIILLHEKDIGSPVSFCVMYIKMLLNSIRIVKISYFRKAYWKEKQVCHFQIFMQSKKISAKESCLYGIISIRIQIDERLNMKNEILLINVLIETYMVEIYLDRRE